LRKKIKRDYTMLEKIMVAMKSSGDENIKWWKIKSKSTEKKYGGCRECRYL
jgi:hypothetical protein